MSRRGAITSLPNIITLGRLLAVPLLVYFILQEAYAAAFVVFVLAGLSDAVDGFIARAWNAHSIYGAYLDPLADKALLLATYVSLGRTGALADWLVILVVFRDVLIVGGAALFYMLSEGPSVRPIFISKVNTLMQILLAALVLARLGLDFRVEWLTGGLVWVVAATTILSGGSYIVIGMRSANRTEPRR
ncbi:MAG: CDP-alcohol phosphatidyltransferase family protein [Rhodovibrionaceae bacterium]|nr:CDP-alcohol phosphatidyltransferase family protein [Rhodovibrionaceae bacterium]